MIYTKPSESDPFQQGDLFFGIPLVEFNLEQVTVFQEGKTVAVPWNELADLSEGIETIVSVRPAVGILLSQDCDVTTAADLILCEVAKFTKVNPNCQNAQKLSSWVKHITQDPRTNHKWFYLPPFADIGFVDRMAADFARIIRLRRTDLEMLRHRRKAGLVPEAKDHLRERIANFFSRYAYDEWYPLTQEEFEVYRQINPTAQIVARPWQQHPAKPK